MPIAITSTAGGLAHAPVFVTGPLATDVVKVDISTLSSNEIDADGYLKPGVPFLATGLMVTAGLTYGVTIEAVKVAAGNAAGDISGATDCFVAVGTHGVVNRDIMEDNLGRVLTAAEIAGFTNDGAIKLTRT